jgi:hypothetical protein
MCRKPASAKNLGHRDTRMVELHYGHLAPSYVADEVRAKAPKYGLKASNVVPIRRTERVRRPAAATPTQRGAQAS